MTIDFLDLLGYKEGFEGTEDEEGTEKDLADTLRDEENQKNEHVDNYEASFFNAILGDSVLLYALENGKWKFLRNYKKNDDSAFEYNIVKQDMNEKGRSFVFEGSMVQKIFKNYVYYRAVEALDTALLEHLRDNTITFNEIQKFAARHSIDLHVGGIWAKKYPEWTETKKIY